jgi:hypothetical protein
VRCVQQRDLPVRIQLELPEPLQIDQRAGRSADVVIDPERARSLPFTSRKSPPVTAGFVTGVVVATRAASRTPCSPRSGTPASSDANAPRPPTDAGARRTTAARQRWRDGAALELVVDNRLTGAVEMLQRVRERTIPENGRVVSSRASSVTPYFVPSLSSIAAAARYRTFHGIQVGRKQHRDAVPAGSSMMSATTDPNGCTCHLRNRFAS